ncbi:redoxin family protein [Halorubrum sp. JWXQ-INN 858]|uniref:TlpA family protein disulfide reductase n=1 Tax=Halorubrum sp. JWXQ-INN 858 TaxID=2690782 RepID=UPI00135A4B27|nr:TlpA disulfide reductase family protein [Halorubrum sp. JWXQ-INN 858]MWV65428.1 redoxin family protein [Halorubrum sp. JWXQ-INN 858]
MNRRTLLATVAGAGTLGAGAYAASRRDVLTADGDRAGGDRGHALEPARIETLDAPGSEAGHRDLPVAGSTTVIEFFATWCSTCGSYMETLREVNRTVDAEFVSLTSEPVGVSVERADVVDWWREHDGEWTVGLDEELALTVALDASSVPFTAVVDESGTVVYADSGTQPASRLVEVIDGA